MGAPVRSQCARIDAPLVVEKFDVAGGVGDPDNLRYGRSHEAEVHLAFAQSMFGPNTFDDILKID